jgi:peroxiredoxin
MLFSNKNTIDFDLSEIIAELEMPVKKYKPLKPLKSGNHVDDFVLIKDNMNKRGFLSGVETSSSILLRQFSGKPIVVSFYSSQWREHGINHLKHLNFLQKEIKALGANLVIITPDDENISLKEIIWNNSLSLNFYFDQENFMAQKFGVYSDADPAWNKYVGIEVNVPLLATYVLDTGNQIIFDHIDKDLQQLVLSDELLYALNTSSSNAQKRKSA